jgi:hypothetical protein
VNAPVPLFSAHALKSFQGRTIMTEPTYWIGVVAKSDADRAISGAYSEVNHGKAGPLERMHAGDGFAYYSPRTDYPSGDVLQAFTAIGRVRDGVVYQAEALIPQRPFRLAVDYLPASSAPIRPLLESLTFIRNKAQWGVAFRYGVIRVPAEDFSRIAAAMGRDFAADFAR